MVITPLNNGFLLDETFLYRSTIINQDYINLLGTKGDIMKYTKDITNIIDFPGEYDIKGNKIKVIEVSGLLQYIITEDKGITAIISHPDTLQHDLMSNVKTRLLTSEAIKQDLEKLELEGEVQVLGS